MAFRILTFIIGLIMTNSATAQDLITPEWLWDLGRVSIQDVSQDRNSIIYGVRRYDVSENKGHTKYYIMNLNGEIVKEINMEDISGLAFHPTERGFTYIKDDKVYHHHKDTNHQLSDEEVNQYKISPDGLKILFTRDVKQKNTLLDEYPEFDKANAHLYDDLMYRHWDHWEDDKFSNIFLVDLSSTTDTKAINITNEAFDSPLKPFGGMEQISWSPDSRSIFYTSKKLSGKEYAISTNGDIYRYNIDTKNTTNVTEYNQGYDVEPKFSPDGRMMVYNSMQTDGYEADKNWLILKEIDTNRKLIVNEKADMNANHPAFSLDGKKIYFTAGVEATGQLFYYHIKNKKITQVTEGVHNVNGFTPINGGVIATINTMTDAAEIFKITDDGNIQQLSTINRSAYDKVVKAQVTSKWVETTDGKKMKVWYILPPNFDKNKKYPTILYCQGGPQSAVSQFFSYRWNFQLMASQGYVIVAPNRRGLPSFGQEWNEQISGDWGGQAMDDYLSAIDDAIENESFVDKNRVGAIGASYGGYSVYWLAGNHNGRFKSFISHCGLFNLESWYGTTEELFFANHDLGGPYWDPKLKEDYQKFSPHRYAANWDTPILVIHGGQDFRVPVSEGMQAFQLAQLKGLKSKFLYFPEESHWVLSPQNAIIWQKEFFKWLDETLKNVETD